MPSATPRESVTRIHAELAKALRSAELREFMTREGGEAAGSTPEESAAYFRAEVERYAKVVKATNMQPQ